MRSRRLGPSIKDVRTDGFATKEGGRCSKGGGTNLLLSRFIPNAEKGEGSQISTLWGTSFMDDPKRTSSVALCSLPEKERERATGNDFFYLALIAIAILEEDEVE